MELARFSSQLKLPLNLKPKFYPTDNKPAGWMVIAAQQRGLDAQALSQKLPPRDAAARDANANRA